MSESHNQRVQRIAQLVQEELGKMVTQELKDPRVGFATITEVRLSPDLKSARVFVSVYGSDDERASTLKGLAAAAGFLKREIGRRLQLRYTPQLSFTLDDTLDHAERLEAIFGAISEGESDAPAPEERTSVPVETERRSLAERQKEFEAKAQQESKKPDKGSGRGARKPSNRRRQRTSRRRDQ